jgi:hypothetical protein
LTGNDRIFRIFFIGKLSNQKTNHKTAKIIKRYTISLLTEEDKEIEIPNEK